MPIEYIKGSDGSTSVQGATKIKVHLVRELLENPYSIFEAAPDKAEALTTGGSIYRFLTPLGVALAERRTAAPTSSTVNYDGTVANSEVSLTVQQPFQTKAFPLDSSDTVQLDGIDYSDIVARKITNSLVKATIKEQATKLYGDAKILSLSKVATTPLEKIKAIKNIVANYFDINESNADWKSATSAIKAYDYFDGKTGVMKRDMLRISMHPADYMELSNAVTEAGAGSEAQFAEFKSGKVMIIGGVQVMEDFRVAKGSVYHIPLGVIGTPDPDVMLTRIGTKYDELQFVNVQRGEQFFDCVNITPELITKVTFTSSTSAK